MRILQESNAALLLANLGATILDFVVRKKAQSTHLNWYIVEQLPVVPLDRYDSVHFGPKMAGEIVREAVLELTYTAHDMAPFARDMGYLDEAGGVKPPFRWDEDRRLGLRAKLDAVFFHLYGITDRDEVRYIYSTFPIVERQETEAYWPIPLPRSLASPGSMLWWQATRTRKPSREFLSSESLAVRSRVKGQASGRAGHRGAAT